MQDTGCKMQDAGCIPRVRVFRRQVPGTGFQVPGTWHLGPGTRYRIDAEGRTPSTEDRARLPENAHIGYANPMGAFSGSVLGARDPALGHGGIEGDATFPHPPSRPRTEGRTPNPVPGTRNPVPGTCLRNTRPRGSRPYPITPSLRHSVVAGLPPSLQTAPLRRARPGG
jgi:hypothetical protein